MKGGDKVVCIKEVNRIKCDEVCVVNEIHYTSTIRIVGEFDEVVILKEWINIYFITLAEYTAKLREERINKILGYE